MIRLSQLGGGGTLLSCDNELRRAINRIAKAHRKIAKHAFRSHFKSSLVDQSDSIVKPLYSLSIIAQRHDKKTPQISP